MSQQAIVTMTLKDAASATLSKVTAQFPKMASVASASASMIGSAYRAVSWTIGQVGNAIRTAMGYAKYATLGLVGATTYSMHVYAEFQDQMLQIKAVTGATDAAYAALTERAKFLGRTTSFTARQVAEGMTYMGQAGLSATQILAGVDHVLVMARAGVMGFGDAADIAVSTMANFRMKAEEINKIGDVMAATASWSNVTLRDMGETLKYAGPIANVAGQSLTEVSAAIAILGNNGIKATMAGTDLARIMKELAETDAQAKLKSLGVEAVDAAGNIRPLRLVMAELGRATAGMGQAQRLSLFSDLFDRAAKSGAILSAQAADLQAMYERLSQVDGAAAKMAATMETGLGGAWRRFKSAIEGVQIALGEAMGPTLARGMDAMSEWLNRNTETIGNWAQKVAILAEFAAKSLADFLGSTDSWTAKWQTVWTAVIQLGKAAFATLADMAVAGGAALVQGLMGGLQTKVAVGSALEIIDQKKATGAYKTDAEYQQARKDALAYIYDQRSREMGLDVAGDTVWSRAADRFGAAGRGIGQFAASSTPDAAGSIADRWAEAQQQLAAVGQKQDESVRKQEQQASQAGSLADVYKQYNDLYREGNILLDQRRAKIESIAEVTKSAAQQFATANAVEQAQVLWLAKQQQQGLQFGDMTDEQRSLAGKSKILAPLYEKQMQEYTQARLKESLGQAPGAAVTVKLDLTPEAKQIMVPPGGRRGVQAARQQTYG